MPLVQAQILTHDEEFVNVKLQGGVVEFDHGLSYPFFELYEQSLADPKYFLLSLKKADDFAIDKKGVITNYKQA